jgi:23S rRNA (uracil1939-C5)-methyltransferase
MNKQIKSDNTPPCLHFGKCGGCSMQNLGEAEYYQYKQDILAKVVDELGASYDLLAPIVKIGEHSRRRAEFKVAVNKGDVNIGFFAAKSHKVVEVLECPVSDQKLVKILPTLKASLQNLKKPGLVKAVSLTVLDDGLDAVVSLKSDINENDRQKLTQFAKLNNIIRLSLSLEDGDECVYDSGEASVSFAGVDVELPVGAFLQATCKGQEALTDLVTEHLSDCQNIADLYCGCGTYSFPLSRRAKNLSAYEGSEQMVAAMHNAIIKNGLENKITASRRDLFKRPLKEYELNRFDGLVINPPRGGALPQAKNIAQSNVKKVVMVSCNPETFKRDAKCLIDGGYELKMAVAVDQFYWTGHLEVVGVFGR